MLIYAFLRGCNYSPHWPPDQETWRCLWVAMPNSGPQVSAWAPSWEVLPCCCMVSGVHKGGASLLTFHDSISLVSRHLAKLKPVPQVEAAAFLTEAWGMFQSAVCAVPCIGGLLRIVFLMHSCFGIWNTSPLSSRDRWSRGVLCMAFYFIFSQFY